MAQIHEHMRKRTKVALGIAILALVAFAVFLLWLESDRSDGDENAYAEHMISSLQEAERSLAANDPETAVKVFDGLIHDAANAGAEDALTVRKANALFATGDFENARTAITLLGDLLVRENVKPMDKGWAVAELLQFYYQSQHPDILVQIRDLQIFSVYSGLSDDAFLKQAAMQGDIFFPTVFGKLHLATPLAKELAYNIELDPAEREAHAGEIVQYVNASRSLQEEQSWFQDQYSRMLAAHQRAILLSAAAEAGADPALARGEFEAALSLAKSEPQNIAMQKLSLYTRLYLAAHLIEHGETDIKAGQVLVELVGKAESFDDISQFQTFARVASEHPESNNCEIFASLAAASDAFRSFLESDRMGGLTFACS